MVYLGFQAEATIHYILITQSHSSHLNHFVRNSTDISWEPGCATQIRFWWRFRWASSEAGSMYAGMYNRDILCWTFVCVLWLSNTIQYYKRQNQLKFTSSLKDFEAFELARIKLTSDWDCLHWYTREGMDEAEFLETKSNMNNPISEY